MQMFYDQSLIILHSKLVKCHMKAKHRAGRQLIHERLVCCTGSPVMRPLSFSNVMAAFPMQNILK